MWHHGSCLACSQLQAPMNRQAVVAYAAEGPSDLEWSACYPFLKGGVGGPKGVGNLVFPNTT